MKKKENEKKTLGKVQLYNTAWALAIFQLTNSGCIESHADALYVFSYAQLSLWLFVFFLRHNFSRGSFTNKKQLP